jgi:hypothetical protein
MNANGGPQGPMGQQMEGFSNDMLQQQRGIQNGAAGGASQGNHALQDYRKTIRLVLYSELISSRNAIDVARTAKQETVINGSSRTGQH